MKLQIGDDLWTIYTAQLVYLNRKDLCSDSLRQMTSYWLDQKLAKQTGTIKILKFVAFPLLYTIKLRWNVCTIRIYLKMHLKRCHA